MGRYEVKLANDRTVSMSGDTPESACQRAAELYQSDAIAWRHPRTALVVGVQTDD